MSTPDGNLHLVFNGAIFNFLELREELEHLGHSFRSRSDTEVLLAAYRQWGRECLNRLIGMFAFAVADTQRGTLFLARDQLGIKPLYYTFKGEETTFAFASQVSALLELAQTKARAHRESLGEYLVRGRTDHTQQTLFADIEQLLPGRFLEVNLVSGAEIARGRYWDVPFGEKCDMSFHDAAERLKEILTDAVRLHLRSDVPVGSALSGGLDSSSIVCLMRRLQSADTPVPTFTFVTRGQPGFDPAWDEEGWADVAGTSARADMHKVTVDPHRLPDQFGRLMLLHDGPFASPVVWVQQEIFRAAHEAGFRVMLSGQGSDELLAGYRRHVAARLASLLRGGHLREYSRLMASANSFPDSDGINLRKVSVALALPRAVANVLRKTAKPARPAWLCPGAWGEDDLGQDLPSDPLDRMLIEDLEITPLPALLRYEDRNSMAYSIENRLPFLDCRLVKFIRSLPPEYLVGSDGANKNILRAAMRGITPDSILNRRDKMAFPVPVSFWLLELKEWVNTVLARAREVGFLNYPEMQRVWQSFQANGGRPVRDAYLIWRWVFLLGWIEAFGIGSDLT